MPATIQVEEKEGQLEKKKEGEFLVTVAESKTRSSHRVTVRQDYYEKLAEGRSRLRTWFDGPSSSSWNANPRNPFSASLTFRSSRATSLSTSN